VVLLGFERRTARQPDSRKFTTTSTLSLSLTPTMTMTVDGTVDI